MAERVTVRRQAPFRLPRTIAHWTVGRGKWCVGDLTASRCGTYEANCYQLRRSPRYWRRVRTVAAGVRWIVAHAR